MHSRMAVITFIDGGPADPGFGVPGVPGYGGGYPSQGLPGGGYPSHGLPGAPGHPSQPIYLPPPGHVATLPVFPFDPTTPDQELPGEQPEPTPPIQIRPGARFVVKWLACHGLILVPDQGLPETPAPKK